MYKIEKMEHNSIENILKDFELKLLRKDIRNSKNELEKIISKDFIEFGSSGLIFCYDDIINSLLNETEEKIFEIIKMNTKIISENIILVLYTIKMNNVTSNRSSIWKNENNEWKIIFHQGTKVNING